MSIYFWFKFLNREGSLCIEFGKCINLRLNTLPQPIVLPILFNLRGARNCNTQFTQRKIICKSFDAEEMNEKDQQSWLEVLFLFLAVHLGVIRESRHNIQKLHHVSQHKPCVFHEVHSYFVVIHDIIGYQTRVQLNWQNLQVNNIVY